MIFSILSEHIGFSVWVIWSVMVLFIPPPVWELRFAAEPIHLAKRLIMLISDGLKKS